jgi:peptidoglycan/LPS O-acetylase OafA/YrhL
MDSTFWGQVLFTQSFTMAVDTFFFLSAFLAAYFLLKDCTKKPHYNFFRCWFSRFFNRCLRIWPAFATALFGSWFLMPLLADVPGMDPNINASCGVNYGWLEALLFTNNILPWDNRGSGNCFGHTWYLACDMQLYFILPPIVMLYTRARERDLEREKSSGRIVFFVCLVAAVIGSCCYSLVMAWDSETGQCSVV